MLFTQIIHQKQTQKIKKKFFHLIFSTLKSTVVQDSSWHKGAGTKRGGKEGY